MTGLATLIPLGPGSAAGESGRLSSLSQNTVQTRVSGPLPAERSPSGPDTPTKFEREPLRRYEASVPSPWRHGGLKE